MLSVDLILYHARLIGAGLGCPDTGLVALRGGRIAAVTTNDRLEELKKTGTRTVDCEGGTLLPGFHDAHLHLFSMVRQELGVDLGSRKMNSLAELQAALRIRAGTTPHGDWVSGHGYDDFYLGRHPNRHDLDAVTMEHPVVIAHRSLHACVLNSLALKLAGIDDATEETPGATIDREPETGMPSGLLYEMLGFVRNEIMPAPSAEELSTGLRRVNDYLLSRGVTSIQDASVGNTPARYRELREHIDRGDIECRLTMMAGGLLLDDFIFHGLGYRHGDYRLRLGAAKFMLNEVRGELRPSENELTALIGTAHRAGFPAAIHAVADRAVVAAARAINEVRKSHPAPRRHRIEHAAECPPDLVRQLKVSGITMVSQPSFLYHSGERYLATVSTEKLPYLYPYRSWLAAAIPVAASSDSPVVPADPLTGVYAAVTRRTASGEVINPAECIPVSAALHLFTVGGAYAAGEEHVKGSLTPGKLADLVLLDEDPRAVPPEAIREINVRLTVIDGKVVWEA